MTDWKPIESAPRYTRFLINNPDGRTVKVKLSTGYSCESHPALRRQGYTVFDDRGNPTKATHWMPLPDPPKREKE